MFVNLGHCNDVIKKKNRSINCFNQDKIKEILSVIRVCSLFAFKTFETQHHKDFL